MNDCIFCKIIDGEIPSDKVYEDNDMIIIKDIEPKANIHYLAIPKAHYKLLSEATPENSEQLARMLLKIGEISSSIGLKNGYRVIINQGNDAMQTVFHLHIHLLGGAPMGFEDYRSTDKAKV